MARYIGPKCRNCRRFGMKLCSKPATKCAWERRKSPPGVQSTGEDVLLSTVSSYEKNKKLVLFTGFLKDNLETII